jgi:hypothetical protein
MVIRMKNMKIVEFFRFAIHIRYLRHFSGLAERRQRKKMKRDVIKRDIINGGSDEEQVVKKPEKKPTKAQAGFALMHGFPATNVGKNRLTASVLHISALGMKYAYASCSVVGSFTSPSKYWCFQERKSVLCHESCWARLKETTTLVKVLYVFCAPH